MSATEEEREKEREADTGPRHAPASRGCGSAPPKERRHLHGSWTKQPKRGAGREPGATPRGELPENSRQTSSKGSAPAKQRQRAGSPGQPPPPAFFFAPQARRCLPCVGSECECKNALRWVGMCVRKRITLDRNVSAKTHHGGSECERKNASRWVGM